MTRARPALAVLAAALAGPAPAAAQSTRYPKPPVDAEAEAEAKSDFWEEVVRPGAGRYEHIIAATTDALRVNISGDGMRQRISLEEAVALRPDLADGWGYLGVAAERGRDWKACADAYGRAFAIDPRWRPLRLAVKTETNAARLANAKRPLELGWAVCLSRIGELARAAPLLEALVARGEATGESWLRLGEVYMAEGRLAEAITALTHARVDAQERQYARWLLAIAYDRARRPADADAAAAEAGDARHVANKPIPFVPAADVYYLLGFAARNAPEQALPYYRLYLETAPPDAPWRARAREHLDALADLDLATRVDVEGSADRATAERTARAAMPQLRACVANLPTVLIHLRITQVGPAGRRPPAARLEPPRPTPPRAASWRTPASRIPVRPRPSRPTFLGPSRRPESQTPGVSATATVLAPGAKDDPQYLLAIDCIEKIGLGLTLPRPPPGTFSTVRIPVVADR